MNLLLVLLKNADAALFRAKEAGRNTFQFYLPEFNDNVLQRAELLSALAVALKNNELMIFYQPLINLNTDKIIGVEALCRWNHPTLGIISPEIFIPLAEESGLILPIGKWVLETACKQAKKWEKIISFQLTVSVNVSPYQFRQTDFVDLVNQAINESGINPKQLELEITESLILGNAESVSEKMLSLKKLGVRFAMDDFGVGYASLNYIKYFPFDKIKIDKSFIAGITTNSDDRNIVEAIIAMTRTMNLEVLAEGVENSEQVNFLKKKYTHQVQGYYYSPAVDSKKCTELLKNGLKLLP